MMEVKDILKHLESICDDKPFMMTNTGGRIDLCDPQIHQLDMQSMIHHLSRLCRFTGAVNRPMYSVGQHLITCYAIAKHRLDGDPAIDPESEEYFDQLIAVVLHDFEEFAFNDLSSPVKRAIAPSKYKWYAVNLRQKIYEKYGIDWGYHNEVVQHADLNALLMERYWLIPNSQHWPKVGKGDLYFSSPLPEMPVHEVESSLHALLHQLIFKRDEARKRENAALVDSDPV